MKCLSRQKQFTERRYLEQEGLDFDERLLALKGRYSWMACGKARAASRMWNRPSARTCGSSRPWYFEQPHNFAVYQEMVSILG